MLRRKCLVFMTIMALCPVGVNADHDQLAMRLFQGCIDEIDVTLPATMDKPSATEIHALTVFSVNAIAVSMCSALIDRICEQGSAKLQMSCFVDASAAIARKTDTILAALPSTISANGFDPIFFQSAVLDARRPWVAPTEVIGFSIEMAQLQGETARYFHARSARRLYEKSQGDIKE